MSEQDIAFTKYWNEAQPLFSIQEKSGERVYHPALIREIKRQVEQAYKAGWNDSKP